MVLFSIRIRRFLRPSPTLLIVAKPRSFERPARCLDCLAAISIFSSPRYRFFHCRDIDFFIAAISIFHRRDINFSSPRYRFFFVAISIFLPHHGDIHSALQPRPITAPQCPLGAQICLSGAPSAFMAPHLPYGTPHASRRPNAFSAPKFALVAPHLPLWHHICLMAPHMPHGAPMPSWRPNLP